MSFFDYIKQIFLVLIILQVTPFVLRGIKRQYGSLIENRTAVAVLPIRGVLYDSSSYIKQLNEFFCDSQIKAVLLKIECPGTASGTGEAIATEIQALKRKHPKPVIGLVENICTSGGYWIASSADYLIAPGTAILGNIGATFPYLFQLADFLKEHHVAYTDLKAGSYKSAMNPFTPLSEQDKELLQGVLDDTYQQFTHEIARARKLSLSKVESWADGKLFTGQQALKLHLIDAVGSAQHAIAMIKQKALIEGEIEWVHPSQKSSWFGSLVGMDNADEGSLMTSIISLARATIG